jgi:hypothetical protein
MIHDTYEVGAISARQSGELVIRLCHLDVALDVRSGESVEPVQLLELVEPVLVLEVEVVHLVFVTGEEVFGSSERIKTTVAFISGGGAVGSVLAAEVVARQRVSV